MTADAPLVFPGSRTLAGWWKQLTPLQPQALWVGHLLLHHVEALVGLARPCPADWFTRLVLKALAMAATLDRLEECLRVGRQVLRQVLRQLETEGLAQVDADGRWEPTTLGRQAIAEGTYSRASYERRAFHFLESERPARGPHFVSLTSAACTAWPAPADWGFAASTLEACVRQPVEWKQQNRFPLDIQEILGVEAPVPAAPGRPQSWERVMLDRPEHILAALVLASGEGSGERLLGFPVQQQGWELQTGDAAFVWTGNWRERLAELAEAPTMDDWRQVWQAWCQPRNLPAPEVAACVLERCDHRLRVLASTRLVERLRAARSDAIKGEAWLLAGKGRLRSAAQVELVAAKQTREWSPGGR